MAKKRLRYKKFRKFKNLANPDLMRKKHRNTQKNSSFVKNRGKKIRLDSSLTGARSTNAPPLTDQDQDHQIEKPHFTNSYPKSQDREILDMNLC